MKSVQMKSVQMKSVQMKCVQAVFPENISTFAHQLWNEVAFLVGFIRSC